VTGADEFDAYPDRETFLAALPQGTSYPEYVFCRVCGLNVRAFLGLSPQIIGEIIAFGDCPGTADEHDKLLIGIALMASKRRPRP
jgi:hypothetical protein